MCLSQTFNPLISVEILSAILAVPDIYQNMYKRIFILSYNLGGNNEYL